MTNSKKAGSSGDVTALLENQNDPEAMSKVIAMVYKDIRKIAGYYMQNSAGHMLQPTALINEVYMKLVDGDGFTFQSRDHFLNTASMLMRRVLSEYSRNKHSLKRGGGKGHVSLDDAILADSFNHNVETMIALESVLEKLKDLDARKYRVIELRYYLGLSVAEVAEVLDLSERTVIRDWEFTRTWVARELKASAAN